MALINPSNLYSGGQSNWDSTPFVKFALQREAQQKAKDEALDKYFAEKNGKLTSTGMRQQEIAPLSFLKQQMQDYWLKHRNELHDITKDNGKAWGEYNALGNMAQSVIDNSKALNGVSDLAGKIRLEKPDLAKRWNEKTLKGFSEHEQPAFIIQGNQVVSNPLHKTFDINSAGYNPELYTPKQIQDQLEEEIKFNPRDINKDDIQPTNDPYTNKVSTISSYNDDKIKKIADNRGSAFDTDERLSFTFNQGHDLLKTPFSQWKQSHVDNYNKLNDDFKKLYNKDIETPQELYKAEVIASIKDPITTKEELRTNEAKKQSDRVAMAHLNNSLIVGRKEDGTIDINSVGYPNIEINKNFGENVTLKDGNHRVVYVDKIPTTLLATINPTDINKGIKSVEPIEIQQPDGTYRKGYYVDDNNNFQGWKQVKGQKVRSIIGNDDARALYIDKMANTKFKFKAGNQGVITNPSSSNKPKVSTDGTGGWKSRAKKK